MSIINFDIKYGETFRLEKYMERNNEQDKETSKNDGIFAIAFIYLKLIKYVKAFFDPFPNNRILR